MYTCDLWVEIVDDIIVCHDAFLVQTRPLISLINGFKWYIRRGNTFCGDDGILSFLQIFWALGWPKARVCSITGLFWGADAESKGHLN